MTNGEESVVLDVVCISEYAAPAYLCIEEEEKEPCTTDSNNEKTLANVLEQVVRQLHLLWIPMKNDRILQIPEQVNGSTFLLGLCKVLPDSKVSDEKETLLGHGKEDANKMYNTPIRCSPGHEFIQMSRVYDSEEAKKLEEEGSILVARDPSKRTEILESLAARQKESQKKYMVEEKKGGPENKGLTAAEFERYWNAAQKAMVYQCQHEDPIIPFERVISSEQDRDLLASIMDVKSHYRFIEPHLNGALEQLVTMSTRGDNVLLVAAFAHNVICYVHPRRNQNGKSARIVCNAILACHGIWPVPPVPEYYTAVTRDMLSSPRMDNPEKMHISVKYLSQFLALFYQSNPCYGCKKRNCTQRCGQCHYVYYCSKECQKKDWKRSHKLFCTTHKTDLIPWMKNTGERVVKEFVALNTQ